MSGVHVTVACPAAANESELAAAVALELEGTGWEVTTAPAADDLIITVAAEPCASDSPLSIAATPAAGGSSMHMDGIYLPATARTRALALLVAELVTFDAKRTDPTPAPPPPTPATPVTNPEPTLTAAPPVATTPPTNIRDLELELAATRRYYEATSAPGNGLRIAAGIAPVARAPWFRARLDLAATDYKSGYGYEIRGVHAAASLTVRKQWIAAFQLEAGIRGEVQESFAHSRDVLIDAGYLHAANTGFIGAINFRLTANLRARVEVEQDLFASRAPVTILDPDLAFGEPYTEKSLSKSTTITIGIVVR